MIDLVDDCINDYAAEDHEKHRAVEVRTEEHVAGSGVK